MSPLIADRKTLDDATDLMAAFGNFAETEAALGQSEAAIRGNAILFAIGVRLNVWHRYAEGVNGTVALIPYWRPI